MREFQVRVSSFCRMPLTKSKGCKRSRTQVLLTGDASEKFAPRGFQGSREFAKSADSATIITSTISIIIIIINIIIIIIIIIVIIITIIVINIM